MKQPENKLNCEQLKWLQITSSLTFKEMDILMSRFIFNFTLNEIAQRYKIQMERVRQMESNALQKITLHSSLNKKSFAKQKETRKKFTK